MKRAIVLLSGGLDSYTAAAIVRTQGFSLYALTVEYGQRHARELESARAVARALGVERHLELTLDLRAIGGSSLTSDAAVPRDRDLASPGIPSTYVPARNTMFPVAGARLGRSPRRATSSSASTRSTTPATPIAVRSSSARSNRWRRSPPVQASKARDFTCTRRSSG